MTHTYSYTATPNIGIMVSIMKRKPDNMTTTTTYLRNNGALEVSFSHGLQKPARADILIELKAPGFVKPGV